MEELLKELEEAKAKIAEIEKKIEEKKSETRRWKPQKEDNYWYINGRGYVMRGVWTNYHISNERYGICNCFQSPEEAKFVAEKLKVIAELKEFEEMKDRKWDGVNLHYCFFYNYGTKEIDITCNYSCKSGNIYFKTKEKARQAINAIGEDRIKKYYLEVEE